jgi:hypothetical protein
MAKVNPMDRFVSCDVPPSWESIVEGVPEVKAIVENPAFEIVTVTRFEIINGLQGLVCLDVVAPQLLPHLRANLINKGLINRCNTRGSSMDRDTGVEKIFLSFFAGKLMMHLRVKKDTTTEFGPEKPLRELF